MSLRLLKSLLITVLSSVLLIQGAAAQEHEAPEKEGESTFNPGSLIMEHISDNHDFHFFDWKGKPVAAPLPVIVYSKERGFDAFMSSRFEHGHAAYKGYKLEEGKILAVNEAGQPEESIKVYDFSMTKNVVQMLLAMLVLIWIMTSIAGKYRKNGHRVAPSGFQNAVEPVVTFIRDDVAKVNLGKKYEKYMPYLLTVFFFILINNLFGLVPGTANVTGNIAFTAVLGVISFIAIMISTNRHFWGHIIWPPGIPLFVKVILVPVEILGIFTKPFALIIRLFANMVAGHIVITCFIMLIFIFGAMNKAAGIGFTPVSIAFTVFIYFIEILVAFIQAFIFTNLTAVFIGQAFEGSHDHDEHGVAHDDQLFV
jgi:F-type H+-transporting ATPase subunit a